MLGVAKRFGLPSLLLALVVVTHMSYDLIGSFYPDPVRAATAWHSVLRAFEAMALYIIVWTLVPWAPVSARYAASLACAWGALESFQIGACRLMSPMDRPPPKTELYAGLCDLVTGWPVYMLTAILVLLVSLFARKK